MKRVRLNYTATAGPFNYELGAPAHTGLTNHQTGRNWRNRRTESAQSAQRVGVIAMIFNTVECVLMTNSFGTAENAARTDAGRVPAVSLITRPGPTIAGRT